MPKFVMGQIRINLEEVPESMKNFVKGISANAEDLAHLLPLPCLHPNCSEKPVGCHSQQCNGALSVIANDEGKVIVPSKDAKGSISRTLNGEKLPRGFYPLHINKATRFNGFCDKHDDALFAVIEKRPLVIDDEEQVLAFHRRAVALEIRSSLELFGYFKIERELLVQKHLVSRSLEDEIATAKARIATTMRYGWNPLWCEKPKDQFHHAWRVLPKKLPISLAAIIVPDFDNNLHAIYERILDPLGVELMPQFEFTLTIVPQEDKTHIVMVWNKIVDPVIQQYRDRLMSSDFSEVEKFLNECVFCLSEEWCMNPDAWNKIPQNEKDELRQQLSMEDMRERTKKIPHIITIW